MGIFFSTNYFKGLRGIFSLFFKPASIAILIDSDCYLKSIALRIFFSFRHYFDFRIRLRIFKIEGCINLKFPSSPKMTRSIDLAVKYIVEASVKLECGVLTRSKALLIYHHFKRCVQETKYDPHLVAASCLTLSIKNNEEPVEFDAIVIVFFCMINPGSCPSTQDEKFKEIKKSVTSMNNIILRMIEFTLTHVLAHQFLPYFMYEFKEETSHYNVWEAFAQNCMRITSDFYFTNKCLNYKAEEIASTAVQVSLYLIGIEVTNDECYLKTKIKGLCSIEESRRQDIIEDIFKICDLEPVSDVVIPH